MHFTLPALMPTAFMRCLCAVFVAAFCLSSPPACAAAAPKIYGKQTPAYARIIFDWPEKVTFHASMEGSTLKVTFSRPFQAQFGDVMISLKPHIVKASLSGDLKTALFTLDAPYRIRSFISGNLVGVDLLKDSAKAPPAAQAETKPEPDAKQEAQKPSPAKVNISVTPADGHGRVTFAWDQPVQPKISQKHGRLVIAFPKTAEFNRPSVPKELAQMFRNVSVSNRKGQLVFAMDSTAPLAIKRSTRGSTVVIDLLSEKLPPAQAAAETKPAAPVPEVTQAEAPATPAAPETPTPPEAQAAASPEAAPAEAPETAEPQARPSLPEGPVVAFTPSVKQENGITTLTFPWTARAAMAAFVREGALFIVFDKPARVNLSAFGGNASSFGLRGEQLPHSSATVLRFVLPEPLFASVQSQQFAWQVMLTKHRQWPAFPIKLDAVMQSAKGPHLFLAVLETADPVSFTDPQMQDELRAIPVFKAGSGVYPGRRFVEFALLETAQGAALQVIREDTAFTLMRNGVSITAPEGLSISPELEQRLKAAETVAAADKGQSLFPYEAWKLPNETDLPAFTRDMRLKMMAAPQEQRDELRLRLLQAMIAEEHYPEALGMIDYLQAANPDLARAHLLSAVRGGVDFMLDRPRDAQNDFLAANVENHPEIEFWKQFLRIFTGETGFKIDYLTAQNRFLSAYPPKMRQKLALMAADEAIRRREYKTAMQIFSQLEEAGLLGPVLKQVHYMRGKIYAETGKNDEAIALWSELEKDADDRSIRARAAYSRIVHQLSQGRIDRKTALQELDKLRVVWRGDSFEVSLLKTLGDLYAAEKQYFEALTAWRDLVTQYPNTREAIEAAQKMSETFLALFNQGEADAMPPLDALSLFYEFRDLTPPGEDGDTVIRNLADRLVAIDLLDRGAALLTHQVRFRLAGLDKAKVGTRLAMIHVLNRNPQLALDVLEFTRMDKLPAELETQRSLIAARALSELDKKEDALTLIENDQSPEAEALRVDIFWRLKDWPNVIRLIQRQLIGRELNPEPLTEEEGDLLVRLAVAYILDNYFEGLGVLRESFAKLFKEGPQKETFDFLTRETETIDPKQYEKVTADISKFENFVTGLKARLKEKKLSQLVAP